MKSNRSEVLLPEFLLDLYPEDILIRSLIFDFRYMGKQAKISQFRAQLQCGNHLPMDAAQKSFPLEPIRPYIHTRLIHAGLRS